MSSPFWIPTDTTGRLAILARPRGGDWLRSDAAEWKQTGLNTVVSLLGEDEEAELELSDEASECARAGLQFLAAPVMDRGIPDDPVAFGELAAELAAKVANGESVGIHCRIGIGRSPLLAIAVLITLGVPTQEAIRRASAARGRPVPETTDQLEWISRFEAPAPAAVGSP